MLCDVASDSWIDLVRGIVYRSLMSFIILSEPAVAVREIQTLGEHLPKVYRKIHGKHCCKFQLNHVFNTNTQIGF